MKVYRGKISYLLPTLFLPLLYTIGVIFTDESFLYIIWIPFLLLILTPLAYKLEVGNNFVRNSFLGFSTMKLHSQNVQLINYGGIGLWNRIDHYKPIVHGKGLAILASINGVSKTYGLSEKLYGKKAIEHTRSVLS
jgi:hypothetical protein